MELDIISQTLRKAISSHRKLLPITSRDLDLDELDTNNTLAFSHNMGSFTQFCENWDEFLNSLDKFWNQLNAYRDHHVLADKHKSLTDFLATIKSQRTTDDLLKYLDKARNNSQHTLWRHLKESSPFEVITGHGATITFLSNGVSVSGSGDSAKEITIVMKEGLILLNHVKVIERNKGEVIYELPISHLGMPLKPMERVLPQIIGQKGIKYYKKVYSDFCEKI